MDIIDLPLAAQELIAHILFEKFLEIYQNRLGKPLGDSAQTINLTYEETRAKNIDYRDLLRYCDKLFNNNSVEELLVRSYFFRIKTLKHFPDILLSNERLLKFLNRLPVQYVAKDEPQSYYDRIDVIGWEIFRQLTSKYIDNISPGKRAQFVIKLRTNNNEEVLNLKNKCLKLAEQYKGETNFETLPKNISQHVKINTEKEIKELLALDNKQFEEVINAIFSDEKTWIALGAFFVSLFSGAGLLTGGSALAAAANITAKSFKIAAENDKKIQSSEYSLIYRMHNNIV